MTAARAWFGALGLDGLEGPAVRGAVRRAGAAGRAGPWPGHRPEVLFADEPTGALDSVSGEWHAPADRRRPEQGTTVVLVTHDARVAAYADREVVVRDGTVACSPGPDRPMIPLGLRLAVTGGREAIARLVILAAAVGLGVGSAADRRVRHQRGRYLEQPPRLVLDRHHGRPRGRCV